MSTLTSEQAITAIEHSPKPTLELLDDAAAIIGLRLSGDAHKVGKDSPSTLSIDTAKFREQWILRWLIKKLTQAVNVKQTSDDDRKQLLSDERVWKLLNHLMISIPRHASKAIILERNLCQTFSECLATCTAIADPEALAGRLEALSTVQSDADNDRPSKKRKISNVQSISQYRHAPFKLSLLVKLLEIADQIAETLLATNEGGASYRKVIPSNWANGVDEAATFLARLLNATTVVTVEHSRLSRLNDTTIAKSADLLERWIDLWQTAVIAAQNQQKQTSSLAFANHILIPALDFLGTESNRHQRSVCQALERQIATACVLPMRATFQKQFASTWESASIWGSGGAKPQVAKIQKITETLTSKLGNAAVGFGRTEGQQRMATLLSITSRITPASDLVRRRADRAWIEALFLCLCLLLSPAKPENETVNGESNEFSHVSSADDHVDMPVFTSDTCLNALQATGIEPSNHFWQFYVRCAVSGIGTKLPIGTLALIVNLNASIFVPEQEDTTPSLLKDFCSLLDETHNSDKALQVTLDDILKPIWDEFGRRRRLTVLVDFWESKLLDAFHLRSTQAPGHSSGLLWDHPDLLEIFSMVCQRHATVSLCTGMLGVVVKDIARLVDVVGPTHDIFARITLLGSMLRTMGKSSSVQEAVATEGESVPNLICKALQRKTDYQGHRWRLWKMFELFLQLFPVTADAINSPKLESPWTHIPFKKAEDFDSRLPQSKPQLMELFQSFSCIVSSYENEKADSISAFTEIVASLNKLMQAYKQHIKEPNQMLQSWTGLSETMDSAFKLLSACLARLARCSRKWYSVDIVPTDFLKNLASLSFGQPDTESFTDLATAAEAILTETITCSNTNLTDTYLRSFSKGVTTRLPPPLLHAVAQGRAGEHHIHDFCKGLFEIMKTINPHAPHESFIEYLSLATETMFTHPVPALSALDLASYIRFLLVSTSEATPEQLAAAYQLIQLLTQQMFAQTAAVLSDDEENSIREDLLKWAKKQFKEIEASDDLEVLNKYTGYLLLAVAQAVYEIDTSKASKRECKLIEKIKELHATVVIKQCKLLVEDPDDQIDFWQVLVLLDSLAHSQEVKSVHKKLQKVLQKVVQAVLAVDSEPIENLTPTQQTRIIAKLWEILSKYVRPGTSQSTPEFPRAHFDHSIGQEDNKNTLVLRAQLATKYSNPASIVSLANQLRLSNGESQPQAAEFVSIAQSNAFLSIASKIRSLVLDETSVNAETIEVLGHIACLQTVLEETSPASLIVRLELSKIVLDKHSSIVSQHVIDSTLTSILALASSASKALLSPDSIEIKPKYIFDRLCAIISTLLVRYRRRLTGRHHILLPALQNLLKCLFYPPTRKVSRTSSSSNLTYLASLPPWLNPPTYISTSTLPPLSATKFSRLLQQLCDPSASSARHVSKRSTGANDNLTDDVKSLRREVSRHTQYLLQTYCQVMLDGYIAPEVKEKLLPGLYAAMNAMDVEVMRALNAAMDSSQRAIWKDLYADWKKYGRWNQR